MFRQWKAAERQTFPVALFTFEVGSHDHLATASCR